LTTFSSEVRRAKLEGFPLLAFNIVDLASAAGVLRAAALQREAVILQLSARTVTHYGAAYVPTVLRPLIEKHQVTAFIHLDHCKDDQVIAGCISAGFDGVMADGSEKPFEENIAWTRRWAETAHRSGVAIEGEVTSIAGAEDGFTGSLVDRSDPAQYSDFAIQTGVDLLGADIGTAHGHYSATPEIDFAFINAVNSRDLPGMVIHGASGLADSALRRLSTSGIAKINFSTDLKATWCAAVTGAIKQVEEPLAALRAAEEAVISMAANKWHACRGKS
jgi:tagatose 1,6-diphosphate aldolase GatY/KbaY